MYIVFGSEANPWDTRAHYSLKPIVAFLFLFNDWIKCEGLYIFISAHMNKEKNCQKINQQLDTSVLISIGSGYGWHKDGQLNLYQPQRNTDADNMNTFVPKAPAEVLVNTLFIGFDVNK
eukprot:15251664-Ditylum_brightwellii.AAC.1